MCIFDIIKKLENIKHNYLIYALEKYTDQITADDIKKKTADEIKKRELERQTQDELAKPEVKKPTEEVKKPADEVKKPADEVKKPTEEVKKPTEEVKKPTEEVKKFENNIMDSLKWVFISMGILIFLIFVGCLIYWGLYGGNYDEDNTMTIENKYIEHPNNQSNKYIELTNQSNKYIEPTNQSNKYIEPPNVEDKEGSIFSFLSPSSKKEKTSEIESISTEQLDAGEYLESIKKSITKTKQQLDNSVVPVLESKTKAQLDADEYLESIKKSITKQQLDTNKINEDDNVQIQKV